AARQQAGHRPRLRQDQLDRQGTPLSPAIRLRPGRPRRPAELLLRRVRADGRRLQGAAGAAVDPGARVVRGTRLAVGSLPLRLRPRERGSAATRASGRTGRADARDRTKPVATLPDQYDQSVTPGRAALLVVLAGLAGLAAVWTFTPEYLLARGFPLDDAWIHAVYGRSLARSGMLAFNPGVPATGVTSPLWALIL